MVASPPIITSLRADIVPHREFAGRKWFYANPLWYYHRRGQTGEINPSRKFYKLVDPELRELCHLLHDAGVHTTPSCQGHFYGRDHFKEIWHELEREQSLIQTSGLTVKDSETDSPFLFRTPTYQLPWPSFEDFYVQAASHQNIGYLGILVPHHLHTLRCRLHNDPYRTEFASICFDGELSCVLGGSLFNIFVHARYPEERHELWSLITDYLAQVVRYLASPPPKNGALAIEAPVLTP
ncbi:MAG: hypothetical protein L0Y42_15620 [Phycisphaerales bacterium]|nr:hypothetical protein [Phycisphaerales bacterium]